MNDPEFLSVEDVLQIHDQQIDRYGGGGGVREHSLVESAVGMPSQTFGGHFLHEGLISMAAAYAFHIAENQPFVDGNKRTGLVAALVFLDINGVSIADPEGKLYDAMISLAEHRLDKAGLAALLEELRV